MSARIIAVANQKGGVGKTITSINVAAELASRGRRTLLIDLDPQGQSGVGLGVDIERVSAGAAELLGDVDVHIDDVRVQPLAELPQLWVVPSNLSLALAERTLYSTEEHANLVLTRKLAGALADWDDVVIDCPPALGALSLNAFLACNLVVIPLGIGFFSIQGVRMLAKTLRDIFEETGLEHDLRCLVTRFRVGQTVSRDVLDAARQLFGDACFDAVIRENVDVEKSVGAQLPLTLFSPDCAAACDYRAMVDELLAGDAADEMPADVADQSLSPIEAAPSGERAL